MPNRFPLFEIVRILPRGRTEAIATVQAKTPGRAMDRAGLRDRTNRGPGYGGVLYGAGSAVYVVREVVS